ncbi:MAG: DUF2336 domain-containing protein [Caulobacterales bacterium]|nr:DUF2336 domain-containing protein [Caulobacterales bacterium]
MNSSGHMAKLVDLARAKDSDMRRQLLHEITDLFLEEPDMRAGAAGATADDILTTIAKDMEEAVRAELAERFCVVAEADNAPKGLVRSLALDAAITVARPVLERSNALDDATLIDVAQLHGSAHLHAISGRATVSEAVSEAVIARADAASMTRLAQNSGVQLSRRSFEMLVDHAETITELQAPLVNHGETPPDLLNEMYFYVEHGLREVILERSENLDPGELDKALAAARERLSRKAQPAPRDYDDAVKFIQIKKLRKKLNGQLLIDLLNGREWTKFIVAFSEIAELDFAAARRVADNPAVDPLAITCKAAGFERDLFVSMALLRPTVSDRAVADADALASIYDELPEDAAKRAMRFWRLRRDSDAAA